VVRFRAGVREGEPQRLRRFAHASVVEWPRAVSGCLTPAAIVIHRPGTGCFVLRPVGRQLEASPRGPGTARGVWRLIATDDDWKLRLPAFHVKPRKTGVRSSTRRGVRLVRSDTSSPSVGISPEDHPGGPVSVGSRRGYRPHPLGGHAADKGHSRRLHAASLACGALPRVVRPSRAAAAPDLHVRECRPDVDVRLAFVCHRTADCVPSAVRQLRAGARQGAGRRDAVAVRVYVRCRREHHDLAPAARDDDAGVRFHVRCRGPADRRNLPNHGSHPDGPEAVRVCVRRGGESDDRAGRRCGRGCGRTTR
jgi:hypothetical protein